VLPKLYDPSDESDDPIDAESVQLDYGAVTSKDMDDPHLATLDNEASVAFDQQLDSLGWAFAV
jgi:hypothetical protein